MNQRSGLNICLSSSRLEDICRSVVESKRVYESKVDKNKEDKTFLYSASIHGHIGICKSLIMCGSNVNKRTRHDRTPLHIACQYGHIEICRVLIDAGANVNARSNKGWTPLHYASVHKNFEICKELVKAGADLNIRDNSGWTSMHKCVDCRSMKIYKFLLSKGSLIEKSEWGCGTRPTGKNGSRRVAMFYEFMISIVRPSIIIQSAFRCFLSKKRVEIMRYNPDNLFHEEFGFMRKGLLGIDDSGFRHEKFKGPL